ncbi:MAG: hypothetical protein ACP5NK_06135 [Thermoplasmata archaeon]
MAGRKGRKGIVAVIIVVVIIVAGILLYGGVINSPHLQTPSASQVDSATGNSYNQTSTSHSTSTSSSGVSSTGASSGDSATYTSSSGSTIYIYEFEFSNNTAAKNDYNAYVSVNLGGIFSGTVNLTYKGFTYTVLNLLFSSVAISFSGKFLVFVMGTGLSTHTTSAVLNVTIDSMTSFSI